MSVQSPNRSSNPRVMCGMLARATLERFEKKDEPERFRNVYFYNLIRLLEMYRYDALHEHNPYGVLERKELPSVNFPSLQPGLEVVDHAFQTAHHELYPSMGKDELVTYLRDTLEKIRAGDAGAVEMSEVAKLRNFLSKIQE